MLELVEDARTSIDEPMNEAARGFFGQLSVLPAQEVAGACGRASVQAKSAGAATRQDESSVHERPTAVRTCNYERDPASALHDSVRVVSART